MRDHLATLREHAAAVSLDGPPDLARALRAAVGELERRRARAVVASQPHHEGRAPTPDAAGWRALHDLTAAAFGDHGAWQASIPARDDDTDLVAHRWVRELVAARDELAAQAASHG